MREQLTALASLSKSFRRLNDLLRYNPIHYRHITRVIRHVNQTDAYHRARAVEPLLNAALNTALKTPYGKGRDLTLSNWPILQKSEIKANPSRFQTWHWPAIPAATSGSSGEPLRLKRSLKNIAAEQAFLDSLLGSDVLTFRQARTAILRGDTVKDPADAAPPFGEYRHSNQLVLSFPHLNEANVDWFIEELLHFRPDVFWVYPTGADFLASLCLQRQQTIPVPVVLSSSEMLTTQARHRIEKAFRGEVVDYYGQAERVCLSYQKRAEEAWFHPAYGFVELFPDDTFTDDHYRRARVVATGYWKDKMPLVRYDTNDFIMYPAHYTSDDLALVALGLKPFTQVVGRASEFLVTPTGERIQALNNIPKDVLHLRRAQFIQQQSDCVEVRLDVEPAFSATDQAKFLKNARAKIPPTVDISITTNQPLEVTESGKTPFVIRTIEA